MPSTAPLGFSTGALALGDAAAALALLAPTGARAVEVSALRRGELEPLVECFEAPGARPELARLLAGFEHLSIHAPSRWEVGDEAAVVVGVERLRRALADLAGVASVPVVVHPDAVDEPERWRGLGADLLLENMDARKPTGRDAAELAPWLEHFPEARLCLDLAHALQIDRLRSLSPGTILGDLVELAATTGRAVAQLHLSTVDDVGRHHRLDDPTLAALARSLDEPTTARALAGAPVILESPLTRPDGLPVPETALEHELTRARSLLAPLGAPDPSEAP